LAIDDCDASGVGPAFENRRFFPWHVYDATCWAPWAEYFAVNGYRALAPAWPGRDRPAAELRDANPDPTTAKLGGKASSTQ
jgi:hypothetical protein